MAFENAQNFLQRRSGDSGESSEDNFEEGSNLIEEIEMQSGEINGAKIA
jgi:hypothetical protein